jgi:ribosome-associated protein
MMNKFSLEGRPHIELCDLLKIMGFCSSGGVAKNLIAEGNVIVDGEVERRKRCKLHVGQVVVFNENQVIVTE